MSEQEKIIEYQKLIEQNQFFADHIKRHNLTDDEIKEMKLNADKFLIKILSSKTLYNKLREETAFVLYVGRKSTREKNPPI